MERFVEEGNFYVATASSERIRLLNFHRTPSRSAHLIEAHIHSFALTVRADFPKLGRVYSTGRLSVFLSVCVCFLPFSLSAYLSVKAGKAAASGVSVVRAKAFVNLKTRNRKITEQIYGSRSINPLRRRFPLQLLASDNECPPCVGD